MSPALKQAASHDVGKKCSVNFHPDRILRRWPRLPRRLPTAERSFWRSSMRIVESREHLQFGISKPLDDARLKNMIDRQRSDKYQSRYLGVAAAAPASSALEAGMISVGSQIPTDR